MNVYTLKLSLVALLVWASCPFLMQAAPFSRFEGPIVKYYKDSPLPQAVVLSVSGQCRSSVDGQTFKRMKVGDTLDQGAVIQTGNNSRADLFMRRMAITIRVNSDTDLQLEKMVRVTAGEETSVETVLNLREGGILCFVRGIVPTSKFEVKHSGAKSIVEGEGSGGFEVRADSAAVAPRQNYVPLKVVSDFGVAVVAPGQKYDLKKRKVVELASTELEETLMQLDELQSLAELLTPAEVAAQKRAEANKSSTSE